MNRFHSNSNGNIKSCITTLLITLSFFSVNAQIPSGYYDNAEGLSGSRLKTALFNIISTHTALSYNDLWTYFPSTDCKSDDATQIWDMYSDSVSYFSYHYGLEREHCVPKSWWNEDDIVTATGDNSVQYCDLFNMYPANGDANQAKLNYPLCDVTSGSSFDNGSALVGYSSRTDYTGKAFEPADEYKGDFARTYLYMATCYQDIDTWNTYSYCMFVSEDYPGFTDWSLDLLLEWCTNDPVSTKETDRNDAVYQIQGNRNPYIDYPEMINAIWSDTTSVWTSSTTEEIETLVDVAMFYANGICHIKNANGQSVAYTCYDISGNIVLQSKSESLDIAINCSSLSKGVYVFSVATDAGCKTLKCVVD